MTERYLHVQIVTVHREDGSVLVAPEGNRELGIPIEVINGTLLPVDTISNVHTDAVEQHQELERCVCAVMKAITDPVGRDPFDDAYLAHVETKIRTALALVLPIGSDLAPIAPAVKLTHDLGERAGMERAAVLCDGYTHSFGPHAANMIRRVLDNSELGGEWQPPFPDVD